MNNGNYEIIRQIEYPPLKERPVEITESVLCRDTETMQIKLFLNMKNVSTRCVTEVKADICCFSEETELLSSKKDVLYSGINILPDELFGKDTEIEISSLRTASVTVTLSSVKFSDGDVWLRDFDNTDEIPVEEINTRLETIEQEKPIQKTADDPWENSISPEKIRRKKRNRIIKLAVSIFLMGLITAGGTYIFNYISAQNQGFNAALSLFEKGDYQGAYHGFNNILSQKYSKDKTDTALLYRGLSAANIGNYTDAAKDLASLNGAKNSSFYLRQLNTLLSGVVSAGDKHSVALKKDGTAIAAGDNEFNQCNVSDWTDLVAVDAGANHTLGIKTDGTVIAVGNDDFGQLNTSLWKNAVDVAAGTSHSVLVQTNGRVTAVGNNDFGQCDTAGWSGIIGVAAGANHTVGLRQDGTLMATGDNSLGACDVSQWKNVVFVAAGKDFTVAVLQDGSVVATGDNSGYQCNTTELTEISSVSAGAYNTLALSRGRLTLVGDTQWHQDNVALWKQLLYVDGGLYHTIGVSSDGTAYASGDNKSGQCNVENWTGLGLPDRAKEKIYAK